MNNNLIEAKKQHVSRDKKIVITKTNNSCSFLLYYDKGEIKKAKIFLYPVYGTQKDKKEVDRKLNQEYRLWLHCLWYYGHLEEDDWQLTEYQMLDKNNKL